MRLHKTGHPIADTISDLIGDLPDAQYEIAYGILRHNLFHGDNDWFELDKGFWYAGHYGGNYRASYKGTQPTYNPMGIFEPHGLELRDWQEPNSNKKVIICPPTTYVCAFFGIEMNEWIENAKSRAGSYHAIKLKEDPELNWEGVDKIITFNSTIGIEALKRGIPVDSDPVHSTIGSWNNSIDAGDRDKLLSFIQAHQFKLADKDKLIRIIEHYI